MMVVSAGLALFFGARPSAWLFRDVPPRWHRGWNLAVV